MYVYNIYVYVCMYMHMYICVCMYVHNIYVYMYNVYVIMYYHYNSTAELDQPELDWASIIRHMSTFAANFNPDQVHVVPSLCM